MGILFSLILQAIKIQTRARDKYHDSSDSLKDTDVIIELVEMITGNSFVSSWVKTFGKCTTQFKTCQDYGTTYIPSSPLVNVIIFVPVDLKSILGTFFILSRRTI